MDLWGIGNRNVFLTIWHLLWRPGYLMYDYLRSKHRAYFPPIPLLVAICLLFTLMVSALNITWDTSMDAIYDIHTNYEEGISVAGGNQPVSKTINNKEKGEQPTKVEKKLSKQILSLENLMKAQRQWSRDHIEYSLVISNLIFILLASWIFHQSPRIQLTIVESFYVQMFIVCQMMIIAIPYTLISWEICESTLLPYLLPTLLSFVILIIDYYQLCGFSIWGTIWRVLIMIFVYFMFSTFIGTLLTIAYLLFPLIEG
jgi:hypothetical protein